jgi:MFS transporter, MHS family, proline/betaine transporter
LIESAPADRRGFYGSWQMVGQGVAGLLGALVSAAVTRNLTPEALDGWGWRMPFLFGLVIGPVGLYIRRHLDETEAFIEASAAPRQEVSFGTLIATHFREVMVCLGLAAGQTIQAYVILLYMPTFATTQLGLPLAEAFTVQSIGIACLIVAVLVFGALSDQKVGSATTCSHAACWSRHDKAARPKLAYDEQRWPVRREASDDRQNSHRPQAPA